MWVALEVLNPLRLIRRWRTRRFIDVTEPRSNEPAIHRLPERYQQKPRVVGITEVRTARHRSIPPGLDGGNHAA